MPIVHPTVHPYHSPFKAVKYLIPSKMTALPPSPHTPPKAIDQSTINGDVRLYVYNLVRRYDEDLDE